MHQKRNLDSGCFRRGKCLVPIHVRGNQTVPLQNDPLIRISGAILLDPIHLAPAITGRDHSDDWFLLKAVRNSLKTHISASLIISGISVSSVQR